MPYLPRCTRRPFRNASVCLAPGNASLGDITFVTIDGACTAPSVWAEFAPTTCGSLGAFDQLGNLPWGATEVMVSGFIDGNGVLYMD
jgi:hypothetical protein